MNLRKAAGIALCVFAMSLALPALQFRWSSSASSGWETAVFSGTQCIGVLLTPSNLKGLLLGGAALSDRFTISACLSGTGANLLLLFAIGCAYRRRHTFALIAAATALAAGSLCTIILQSDQAFQPLIGIWLWIGSMLWLCATAAWQVWRIELGGGHGEASISSARIPA